MKSLTCLARTESLRVIRQFVHTTCAGHPGMTEPIVHDLQLAVDEACANIIEHGYAATEPGAIEVELDLAEDRVVIRIRDSGRGFDPKDAPRPDAAVPLELRPLGGFGIYFIYKSVDDVHYESRPDGNLLTLTKHLLPPPARIAS